MTNIYFPIRFEVHIVLTLLAILIFGLQFIRFRRPKYLILAIILPITLLPYAVTTKTMFYTVGIAEAVGLLACLVLHTLDVRKDNAALKAAQQAEPEEVAE